MKLRVALLLFWMTVIPANAQVIITPTSPPVVNQGSQLQFEANGPVTWSMSSGSKGSIDPVSGIYTAPANVQSQQSYAGCQVLPNDHIYNSRIDSLPVNVNSSMWIAGAGSVPLSYEIGFPVNIINSATPQENMTFLYTGLNNGAFAMPQYPFARIEGGWLEAPFGVGDRHLLTVDPTACNFQDIYDPYVAGANTQCPTCTAQSGVKYSGAAYDLASSGAADAAGLYITPLVLKLQEVENAVATGGTVNHALRFTLNSGYCASSNIWPAQTFATDGGTVPFGARFRLKSSFDISSFSKIAQILLTQLKQYGLILADGGTGWATQVEDTTWPLAYQQAFQEIRNANIAPNNFEAVDESQLMLSTKSGVTSRSETVVATSTTNPNQSATQYVVLTGMTLNLPKDKVYIQAGSPAQQLVAYVQGFSNTKVTWSMNPTVGTLTSDGVYTPPAAETFPTATTITAVSVSNALVSATMSAVVMPNGTIRIVEGQTSNYTDKSGNLWYAAGTTYNGGDDGGYPYDNGGTWPTVPDITLYKIPFYSFGGGDMRFDIAVPNGTYSVTGKFASTNVSAPGQLVSLESQGQVIYNNVDIFAKAGGQNLPLDFTLPATVTNGQLSFVLRHVTGSFNDISALQIVPVAIGPDSQQPNPPSDVRATVE